MFNASQLNCLNLVYTCNIALILFLKCDVTKSRIPPPPLSHNVTISRPPFAPLTCEVIYVCPLMWPSEVLQKQNMGILPALSAIKWSLHALRVRRVCIRNTHIIWSMLSYENNIFLWHEKNNVFIICLKMSTFKIT